MATDFPRIGDNGMQYKQDLAECQRRVEAWWQHEIIDRAVIQARAPLTKNRPYTEIANRPHMFDAADMKRSFLEPDVVLPQLKEQLANTYFGGEAFPVLFPVSTRMVAIVGNYLGCPMEFVGGGYVWSEPVVDAWEGRPRFVYDPEGELWRLSKRLLTLAVESADGYFVGIPDLNGPTEIISRLRGSERLAMDFYDNPVQIKPSLVEINQAWYDYWQGCIKITQEIGGYFYWMGIWSELPSVDLQSDFACMISTEMFDEYFLPFIEEQTLMVDRTIFHLDGPGAVRHLDSLLSLPALNGIQWVPGAGSKPTVEWIPLLQKVQAAGKLLYVYCEKTSVKKLLSELNPEGLMMVVSCDNPSEAEQLLENARKWT
jgi:hypothetical protein